MALTRVRATIQEPRRVLWAAPELFLALRVVFPFALPEPPAVAAASVAKEVGDFVSRAIPAISLPTTTPPVIALPKPLDFWMLAISPPESLLEIEFWRESVRRMFECSVTSGRPPNPVVYNKSK